MLDFAIFAVTFLLALVGAVLYLYPVTAALVLGGGGGVVPGSRTGPHPSHVTLRPCRRARRSDPLRRSSRRGEPS